MSPKAVLLKTGLTPLNTIRPVNTAHPKTAVHNAKSKTHFFKQAQSIVKRPFYMQTTLTRRSMHEANRHYYTGRPKAVNTARSYTGQVNTIRVKGGKPQHDDKGLILLAEKLQLGPVMANDNVVEMTWAPKLQLLTKFLEALFEGRHIKRGRDTKIPQSSGPPDKGSGPRCQDTILGDVNAQTRFKIASKQSNDLWKQIFKKRNKEKAENKQIQAQGGKGKVKSQAN
ncbi:hypothetical protein Tco_1468688 [Tanacetum coccineum]